MTRGPVRRIYVAGHTGMVGSAILRTLRSRGHDPASLIVRRHAELDLTDTRAVSAFFAQEKPEDVYLAAARVGGILANDRHPAEFIRENILLQTSVIHTAYELGVRRLLFLGSSCIYPRLAQQPMTESAWLSGPLEPTNRAYAIAKIAGVEMCWSYNRQLGTQFLSVMPTNLYGLGDNYHPDNAHVIPALMRRFHGAKELGARTVTVWGTGTARREFMYADDLADACVFLMNLSDELFTPLLAADRNDGRPPIVNIGVGEDITISELAAMIAATVGFEGAIECDTTKPDGAPRKLLDSSALHALGWRATTRLDHGLAMAYEDFKTRYTS